MAGEDQRVRHAIYAHFVATGAAPTGDDVAAATGLSAGDVARAIDGLAEAHAIALAPGSRNVWMAHPFSAVPTAYPVTTAERTYWANCAWDALGIPALLGADSETRTQCADCAEPLTIQVRGDRAEPTDAVVHFLVPPRRFWENVGFT